VLQVCNAHACASIPRTRGGTCSHLLRADASCEALQAKSGSSRQSVFNTLGSIEMREISSAPPSLAREHACSPVAQEMLACSEGDSPPLDAWQASVLSCAHAGLLAVFIFAVPSLRRGDSVLFYIQMHETRGQW
jgi:hypothetical protein